MRKFLSLLVFVCVSFTALSAQSIVFRVDSVSAIYCEDCGSVGRENWYLEFYGRSNDVDTIEVETLTFDAYFENKNSLVGACEVDPMASSYSITFANTNVDIYPASEVDVLSFDYRGKNEQGLCLYRLQVQMLDDFGSAYSVDQIVAVHAYTYDASGEYLLPVELVENDAVTSLKAVGKQQVYALQRRIVSDEPFTIYSAVGVDVTSQNGVLEPGVYLVCTSKGTSKVYVAR